MTTASPAIAVAERAASLKPIDVALLRALVQRLPPGQSVVRLLNDQLAKAVRRTPRTVQSALGRLVKAGLVTREARASIGKSAAIGTEVTWPLHHAAQSLCSPIQVVDSLAAAVTSTMRRPTKARARRPVDPTMSTDRFEFRHLREAHRIAHLPEAVASAGQDCQAFVEFLARGFGDRGSAVEVHLLGLRRKVRDGKRGAPSPQLTMPLVGDWRAPLRWASHLRHCMADEMNIAEAMFKVEEEHHPLLLVDDVREEALARIPPGSAVVETSPGCFQVSAFAPRNLRPQERIFAQRALIELLGGDGAANSSNQLRRMPGSVNNKADLGCAFVSRLVRVDSAPHFDHLTLQHLLDEGWVLSMGGSSALQQAPSSSPSKPSATGDITQSGRDIRWVMRRLANGEPESVVRRDLERSAILRGKSRGAATGDHGYTGATMAKAKKYLAERGALPRPAAAKATQ